MEWHGGSTRVDDQGRRKLLDTFYYRVKCQILKYQSGSIGLFPLHTNPTDKQKACESHVRENVYCAMAIWALGQAYRHMDDNQGRYYELKQSAVKCMRGLLFCFMRQSKKLELFKKNQRSENSLHVIFNINTGDALYQADTEYPHLQIDAVSLYLLTMAQMIASGLQIIYTSDEVNFVQNLVYYIERAYRTPDYGMWERGTKENTGHKELNAVSIGMAKAALETINGFNLYGNSGTSSSVIYVDPDAHNRNHTILHSLLPVASSSKVTDAALLMITGFPAFAIDDDELRHKTKSKVLENLEGKYGLKRFIKDGYKCVLEDKNRKYYEKRELELFHGIECEWPIFFVYLAMDALFRQDKDTTMHYIKLLQDSLLKKDSEDIIPKYYFVPKFHIDAERRKPHSQVRLPCCDDNVFMWGQALLIMMELLAEDLLDVNEIDPLGRHLSLTSKKYGYINDRYSSFAVAETDLVVQVALISESRNLQTILSTFGIETQTPQQIEPIQIWPPSQLILAYERLGVNRKLSLLGRPTRPIGALGTSKIYRILGKTVVTYPKLFDEQDFYMSWDMFLVIDQIKTVISFVRSNWSMRGRPTVCFLLRENNLRGKHFHEMLELLASFKNGECGDTKVRLGKLQTLISTGCVEHLDFVQPGDKLGPEDDSIDEIEESRVKEVETVDSSPSLNKSGRSRLSRLSRSLTQDESVDGTDIDDEDNARDLVTKSREALVAELREYLTLNRQMLILQELLQREGKDYCTPDGTIFERIDQVYRQAGYERNWLVVRRGAGLLRKLVDSLAPGITTLLVSGKVVTIGMYGHDEKVIYEPMTPASIQNVLYTFCYPHDVREAVLQQEMVLYLASYMATMPKDFEGMLKIRIGWIIQAMKELLTYGNNLGSLYAQPPSAVKKLLKIVLKSRGRLHGQDLAPRTPLQKRQLDGAVHRTPLDFYNKVWNVLCRAAGGIMVSNHHLHQLPTISDMTQNEINFQLKVEELLNDISNPEHRQLIVELIVVLATIMERNPEVKFEGCVDLDKVLQDAINLFNSEQQNNGKSVNRESFYNTQSEGKGGTATYLTRAIVNRLLGEGLDHTSCAIS